MTMKWWGWGEEGRTFSLPDPERFWGLVSSRLGEPGVSPRLESADAIALPPSRLEGEALAALRRAVGEDAVATDTAQRAVYSLGKGYRDAVRIRRGEVPHPTDAVVRPQTEEQVAAVLAEASRRDIAVVPFGGGTTVVGGVEPTGDRPTITLHLQRLARVLAVDPVSATATVQAGILGPALEAALNARGFTLGHFPQSFQFSSLGGWIAPRSGGQKSTLYGKIEERVQSLRLSFPGGTIATRDVPAAAAGPDLNQLIAGSEGILGVITQATMRLAPLPQRTEYRGYL
ncbi:MAG TPA: FAD-binding oxidoreductase, partial [Dehalococcoidia bacterium]|nr:FAD-binding oxidoreductase [Dehalococcoidia bacterium]